jgi:hypothetical protein
MRAARIMELACMNSDDDPHHPALIPALRWMANALSLWGLCAKPGCRRAQGCKGDPRQCLARYAPLAPEEARDGVAAMLEGLQSGLSFDDVRDEACAEIAALDDWNARVAAARDRAASRAVP